VGVLIMQGVSKLLSGFPWPINGSPDNNLESLCTLLINICSSVPYFEKHPAFSNLECDSDRGIDYLCTLCEHSILLYL
jgi:hypothetical protein